ncbi:MAG: hypothetical protein KC620_25680, partial [Myxococcales bacterium]|nr:hypothetical protein [Myxococcales bacterium]
VPPPPPPAPTVEFTAEVWPILKKSCVRCHGPKKQKGELRLDSRAAAMAGGEDGPVIVAGRPEESDLYRRVSLPHDDEDYMPSKGDPLTDEQVEVLRRWIAAGAAWPE